MKRTADYLGISLASLALSATTTLAIEKPLPQPVDGKISWLYSYADQKGSNAMSFSEEVCSV